MSVRSFDPDGPSVTPKQHRCDSTDINYARVEEGFLECLVCGRTWELNTRRNRDGKITYAAWWPYPCPRCNVAAPACLHYGRRK